MTTKKLSLVAALLALPLAPVSAQTLPLDLTVGYRFLTLSGSEEMYRTQINERNGFMIRSLTFLDDAVGSPFLDRIRVDANDLFASPAGALRLSAVRTGVYDLRLSYRRAERFSAFPTFQLQTIDRVRTLLDIELSVLPGGIVTPIVGYTRNVYSGPGRTTYSVGQDQFRLTQDLNETEQEVRVGASFAAGPVSGEVIQGWRKLSGTETLALAPDAGSGESTSTVLGTPVSLNAFSRTTSTDVNTPVTTATVVSRLAGVKLVASYVRAGAGSDTESQEGLSGALVSFALSRFFSGLAESVDSRARSTMWRGGARVEGTLGNNVDLSAGVSRRHRSLDGFALIQSLYQGTTTFAGQDPRNLLKVLDARTALDRTDDVFEVGAAVRALGPVTVRLGLAQINQRLELTADPSEIVIPGGQGGDFSRRIRRLDAGATAARSGVTLALDYRREIADVAIVRTDFRTRDRLRLRASWAFKELFRLGVHAEGLDQRNGDAGIGFDARSRQWGAEAELTPVKGVRVRAGAMRFTADSTLSIRAPQDFSTAASNHEERGSELSGGLSYTLDPLAIETNISHFDNTGSYPFGIDRARVLLSLGVAKQISVIGEWSFDSYSEPTRLSAAYDAHRYGLYLRWHPID